MHFGEFRLLFWQEAKMYLRKKATLIGSFGKFGCLFAEPRLFLRKKATAKTDIEEKGCFSIRTHYCPMVFCRPEGRSAPLACCLPRAAGRRGSQELAKGRGSERGRAWPAAKRGGGGRGQRQRPAEHSLLHRKTCGTRARRAKVRRRREVGRGCETANGKVKQ